MDKVPTVESHLQNVLYTEDFDYVPSDFSLQFINFIKMVNGAKGEEHKSPVIHYRMLDQLPGKQANIANLCSRGLAKSAVFAEYLILYLAVYRKIPNFGEIDYMLYISDSIENGVKKMRYRIERRRENSSFLTHYIPEVRFTDIRWYFKNKEGGEMVVSGHGAKTGVRGTVELNTRPQLAVLDDLISDDDARSDTVIAAVEDTVYKAVDYALHPSKHKKIWSGTPFNSRDPLYKAIESGAWATNVFPICETFPCTREDFKGAWEDRFTYDYVKEKYETALKLGKVDTFNQELMLRIISDEERMILDCDVNWYTRKNVLEHRGLFNFYITTDFATSIQKSADFSVIFVWALNANGDWYWVDGMVKKTLMDDNINKLFGYAQEYQPQSVGIEVTGQQGGFIRWIQNEMMVRNNYFNLASDKNNGQPGIRPTTDKMTRFNTVVPWFKAGKMHFPEELKDSIEIQEIINELSLATQKGFKSKHDDAIDGVSQLGDLIVWRPSERSSSNVNTGDKFWDDIEDEDEYDRLSSYVY